MSKIDEVTRRSKKYDFEKKCNDNGDGDKKRNDNTLNNDWFVFWSEYNSVWLLWLQGIHDVH